MQTRSAVSANNDAVLAGVRGKLASGDTTRLAILGDSTGSVTGPLDGRAHRKNESCYARLARMLKQLYGDGGHYAPASESEIEMGSMCFPLTAKINVSNYFGTQTIYTVPGGVPYNNPNTEAVWTAATAMAIGDVRICTAGFGTVTGAIWRVKARAGDYKTGAAEPAWPALTSASVADDPALDVVDNNVTWQFHGFRCYVWLPGVVVRRYDRCVSPSYHNGGIWQAMGAVPGTTAGAWDFPQPVAANIVGTYTHADPGGVVWTFAGLDMSLTGLGLNVGGSAFAWPYAPQPAGWMRDLQDYAPGATAAGFTMMRQRFDATFAYPTGSLVLWVDTGRYVSVVYDATAAGSFSVQVTGGGAPGTVQTVAYAGTPGAYNAMTTIDTGYDTPHIVTIVGLSGSGAIHGILTQLSNGAGAPSGGVVDANLCEPGWSIFSLWNKATVAGVFNAAKFVSLVGVPVFTPDLVIMRLGINDIIGLQTAAMASRVTDFANALANAGIPLVFEVGPAGGPDADATANVAYFRTAAAAAANVSAQLVCTWDHWGIWGGLGSHGLAAGYYGPTLAGGVDDTWHFNYAGAEDLARCQLGALVGASPALPDFNSVQQATLARLLDARVPVSRISQIGADSAISRKMLTNKRTEPAAGNGDRVTYDDDGVSVLSTQALANTGVQRSRTPK